MKLSDWMRRFFRPGNRDAANEALVTLLLAAREDENLRKKISSLIRLPDVQRDSLVISAVDEMKLKGEPPEICGAFAILPTSDGAAAAQKALNLV